MKMLKNSLFVSVLRKRKSQKMEKTTKKTVFHGTYSIVDSSKENVLTVVMLVT